LLAGAVEVHLQVLMVFLAVLAVGRKTLTVQELLVMVLQDKGLLVEQLALVAAIILLVVEAELVLLGQHLLILL
jgi:hypothetical protein